MDLDIGNLILITELNVTEIFELIDIFRRIHISMATKNLLGESYQYEPGSRDAYLTKWNVETFLISVAKVDSSVSDTKKTTFKASSTVTSPRVSFAGEIPLQRPIFRRVASDGAHSMDDRRKSSSTESLYEKLPPALPPTNNRVRYSLPHVFTVRIFQCNCLDQLFIDLWLFGIINRKAVKSTVPTETSSRKRSTVGSVVYEN